MYSRLLIHSLALTGPITTIEQVRFVAETAVSLEASGCEMLMGNYDLPPALVATTLLNAGAKKLLLCSAHTDPSRGNPLETTDAMLIRLADLRRLLEYASTLRDKGVEISTVDGPLLFLLGCQSNPPDAIDHAVEFGKMIAKIAEELEIRVAMERLQRSEDGVIQNWANLRGVVDRIGSTWIGDHDDTFHGMKNGDDPVETLRMSGRKLFHYHANGIGADMENEGRIPCGCKDFKVEVGGAQREITDKVDWFSVADAFHRYAPEDCLICLEPFHEEACMAIPPLRTGVVPVTDLGQIRESIRNLATSGLLK